MGRKRWRQTQAGIALRDTVGLRQADIRACEQRLISIAPDRTGEPDTGPVWAHTGLEAATPSHRARFILNSRENGGIRMHQGATVACCCGLTRLPLRGQRRNRTIAAAAVITLDRLPV
jgi:hypothetical protein